MECVFILHVENVHCKTRNTDREKQDTCLKKIKYYKVQQLVHVNLWPSIQNISLKYFHIALVINYFFFFSDK